MHRQRNLMVLHGWFHIGPDPNGDQLGNRWLYDDLCGGVVPLSSWVKFSNTVGGTLICASTPLTIGANPSGCIINFTSNNVFGGDLFGGTNTHFYRISGFVFDGGGSCSSTGTMWFDNANGSSPVTMYGAGNGGIRIDHNTNQNCNSGAVFMFLGHNNGTQLPIGNYSGVADHNLIQGSTQYSGFIYIDQANPTPPSNQLGTIDNFFLEDNTLNFSAMPNASNGGCTDAWGGGSFVARYNTSNDCLWTAHGVTHAGGPANYEFYNNSVTLDSAATGESPIDCYRCFHPQGSGTMVGFGNTFTAPGGYNSEIISVANYRGYASGPSIDAAVAACDGTVTSLSFDGITFSDGNRTPATSNYGYPCWHQPGRDFAGNYAPMYWINNKTGGGALVPMVNPDFGGSVPSTFGPPPGPCDPTSTGNCDYNSFQMKANREWYNAVSASAQSSPTSPFNGTTGAGYGTLANRPTTCTTNATESGAGVGYFATDVGAQGTLYTCSATNTWATYYTPYTYPHPLVSGGTTYTWTVTATNGSVTGTNCPTATGIASGTTIGPCTAVPNAGYVFSSWSGVSGSAACSGATNPCPSFSITANSAVTANFVSGGVTVATGDTRTITEPTFPATCSTVQATKYIVSTNAVNIDPFNSTCGSTGGTFGTLGCTGGTSYEPSSTSGSYTAAETLDNSAITSALSSCPSGQAVELIAGSGGQLGFVLSPLSIPTGVKLILDAGIHVFASRNRTDYGGTNCGLVTSGSSSCNHWITAASTTNSGIYGYGVLDGRGWDAYIGSTTQGFYANRIQAYCNNHGGAINGSPACTPNGSGNNSYGPNGLNIVSASNFTLYKTTVKDSGNFIFNWQGGNGLTAWGAKLIAPFEVSNTDGLIRSTRRTELLRTGLFRTAITMWR